MPNSISEVSTESVEPLVEATFGKVNHVTMAANVLPPGKETYTTMHYEHDRNM